MTKRRMSDTITGDANHVGYGIEVLRSDLYGDEGVDFGYYEFFPEPIPNGKEIFANSNYIYKENPDWYAFYGEGFFPEEERDRLRKKLTAELMEKHGFIPRATLGFKAKVKEPTWTQQ